MKAGWWIAKIVVLDLAVLALIVAFFILAGVIVVLAFGDGHLGLFMYVLLGIVIAAQIAADVIKEWRKRAAVRRFTGKEDSDAV